MQNSMCSMKMSSTTSHDTVMWFLCQFIAKQHEYLNKLYLPGASFTTSSERFITSDRSCLCIRFCVVQVHARHKPSLGVTCQTILSTTLLPSKTWIMTFQECYCQSTRHETLRPLQDHLTLWVVYVTVNHLDRSNLRNARQLQPLGRQHGEQSVCREEQQFTEMFFFWVWQESAVGTRQLHTLTFNAARILLKFNKRWMTSCNCLIPPPCPHPFHSLWVNLIQMIKNLFRSKAWQKMSSFTKLLDAENPFWSQMCRV